MIMRPWKQKRQNEDSVVNMVMLVSLQLFFLQDTKDAERNQTNMSTIYMRDQRKWFSCVVSEALDCRGYSKEQILKRVLLAEKKGTHWGKFLQNSFDINVDVCVAGSKGEGVAFVNSDFDFVWIFRSAVCVEEGGDESGLFVFELDMTETPPGYTKLTVRPTEDYDETLGLLIRPSLTECIVGNENKVYLSSLKYQNTIRRLSVCQFKVDYITFLEKQSNGPAITLKMKSQNPFLKFSMQEESDLVYAFPAHAPSIFNFWKSRFRLFDWPSKELVDDIACTEVICVPVSLKESKYSDLEWRFCFPRGEKKLILSMNSSQIKLYVILKIIFTDIVRKKDFGLTSYMIKNIVCWTCDGTEVKHFTPENLTKRLVNALFFLLQCLEDNMLPCYLLPRRNLLIGKIEGYMKIKAMKRVSLLLNSNCSYLLQCTKLCKSMVFTYMHPIAALKATSIRNLLEETLLFVFQKMEEENDPFHKDAVLIMLYRCVTDPEVIEAMLGLMNAIGFDMYLHIFNRVFSETEKSPFIDMLL